MWDLGSLGHLTVGGDVCEPPVVFVGVWCGSVHVCLWCTYLCVFEVCARVSGVCVRAWCLPSAFVTCHVCVSGVCVRSVLAVCACRPCVWCLRVSPHVCVCAEWDVRLRADVQGPFDTESMFVEEEREGGVDHQSAKEEMKGWGSVARGSEGAPACAFLPPPPRWVDPCQRPLLPPRPPCQERAWLQGPPDVGESSSRLPAPVRRMRDSISSARC